jgi:hypothetical protein
MLFLSGLFENRVLRRIFAPKGKEVTGERRKEKIDEMGWTCGTDDIRNACNILAGKLEGKRPLGRHTRRKEDNIKMKAWTGFMWFGLGSSSGVL